MKLSPKKIKEECKQHNFRVEMQTILEKSGFAKKFQIYGSILTISTWDLRPFRDKDSQKAIRSSTAELLHKHPQDGN